eukprot:CAMPEP_0206391118 /NCGR_PEP_ID=MMETSP0294-20121207/19063_1 /ASSEMBLY_ACC=CAM_ASM_000327 /TAXON_ID=39354 /ORGANISM="Heterosigma akashiwo, Strain CCMP2393" /LENGTH=141 /DNA_ID=CAMNT_0053843725 /DNA_START=72 /DNA_END=494 /DNA_ORIENTATION=+
MSPEELSKNAYKIFYDEMKSEVRAVWESATAAEVDKVLAGRWGQMTPAQRGRFEDLAKSKAAVVAADQARRAMAPPKPKPKGAPGSAGKAATKGKAAAAAAADAGAAGPAPQGGVDGAEPRVEGKEQGGQGALGGAQPGRP